MTSALITPTPPVEDTEKVNAIFASIEDQIGYVPDGIRLYGISPPLLEAFMGNIAYFMAHPRLSQELLAMIRYLVSSDASCSFCIDFNEGLLLNMGKTDEGLKAARENADSAPLPESEKVLLKIALAALENPVGVSKADIEASLEQGFSERDVFDAVVVGANNKAFTHVLRTFNIESQGSLA